MDILILAVNCMTARMQILNSVIIRKTLQEDVDVNLY